MANSSQDIGAQRRLREGAFMLPIVGFFLLTPPFINVFAIDGTFFGIPIIVVYIFSIWTVLIIIARQLARRLMPPRQVDKPDESLDI